MLQDGRDSPWLQLPPRTVTGERDGLAAVMDHDVSTLTALGDDLAALPLQPPFELPARHT